MDMNDANELTNHRFYVPQLTMKKVWDIKNGREIDAREFFSQPESEIINMRRLLQLAINADKPLWVCPLCHQMVKISGRKSERGKAVFFSHLYDSDDCPIKTTMGLTKEQIEASKYGLVAESERHKLLKSHIAQSLNSVNSMQKGICDVQIEKRVDSALPYMRWRKPDVQAKYKEKKLVFELQLSTTFISTIVDRDLFYRLNDYYIIWLFNFEDNQEYVNLSNLMCKDIYYANKRNVFIFDKEAQDESERRGELILKCNWLDSDNNWHYKKKGDNAGGILVSLDQLFFDEDNKKLFYYDADADYFTLHPHLLEKRKQLEIIREEIVEALMKREKENDDEYDGQSQEKRDQAISQMIRTGGQVEVFKKKGKYGMSFEDTIIIPAKYTAISEFDSRGYASLKFNRSIGIVDRLGNIIVPCEASEILILENNYIIYRKGTNKWYLAGIFEAVAPYFRDKVSLDRFDEHIDVINISSFSRLSNINIYIIDGKIVLFKDCSNDAEEGKWGARYINGDIVLSFIFDKVLIESGRIYVEGKDRFGILDYWMNEIIPPVYSSLEYNVADYNNLYKTRRGSLCGLTYSNGKILFDCVFSKIEHIGNKYILEKEGKWALSDENGVVIFDYQDNAIVKISDKYLYMKDDNGLAFLSDYKGNYIKWEEDYVEIEETDNPNLFIVTSLGRRDKGIVELSGKIIVPCLYEDVVPWGNNIYRVRKTKYIDRGWRYPVNEKRSYYLINEKGKKTTPDIYSFLDYPKDGTIHARTEDGREGLLDEKGQMVVDFSEYMGRGYLKSRSFGKWGVTNPDGYRVIPCKYLEIDWFSEELFMVKSSTLKFQLYNIYGYKVSKVYNKIEKEENGKCKVWIGNDYDYLDENGHEIYNVIITMPDGNSIIKFLGKVGIRNSFGKIIIPVEYSDIKYVDTYTYLAKDNGSYKLIGEYNSNINNEKITDVVNVKNGEAEIQVWGKGMCNIDKRGIFSPISRIETSNGIHVKEFFNQYIIEKDKEVIFPYGVYKDIVSYDDKCFSAVESGSNKHVLFDCEFNVIKTEDDNLKYEYIKETNHLITSKESLHYYDKNDKNKYLYGLLTVEGKVLQPLVYKSLYYEQKFGLYIAKNKNNKYIIITRNGCETIPYEFDKYFVNKEDTISVYIADQIETIDNNGQMVLRNVYSLDNLHFIYQWFNGYGIATVGGEIVTEPIYSTFEEWNDNILLCKEVGYSDSFSLLRYDGTIIDSGSSISPLENGLAVVEDDILNPYYIDSQGLPVRSKTKILEGYFLSSFQGLYGLIDSTSNVILKEEYLGITPLHYGLFEIQSWDGFGVINSHGEFLIPCENDCIFAYMGKLVCIKGKDIIQTDISYDHQTPVTLSVNKKIPHNNGLILQIGKKTAFISENTLNKSNRRASQFEHGDEVKVIISYINWDRKSLYARFPMAKDFSYVEGQIIEVVVSSKKSYAVLVKDMYGNILFIHKSMMSNLEFKMIKELDKLKIVKIGFDQQHKKDIWKVMNE